MDAALPCFDGGSVSVLLARPDGTFGSAVSYSSSTHAHSIAAGDFTGDRFPDLVVSNENSTVSVFINRGDGTFIPRVT